MTKRLKLTSDRKSRSTRKAKPAVTETFDPTTTTTPEPEHICDGEPEIEQSTIEAVNAIKADTVPEIQAAATAVAAMTVESAKPEPKPKAPSKAEALLALARRGEATITGSIGAHDRVNQLRVVDHGGQVHWLWATPAILEQVRETGRDGKRIRFEVAA